VFEGVLLFILLLLSSLMCVVASVVLLGLALVSLLFPVCVVGLLANIVTVPLEPPASSGVLISVCWHPPLGSHRLLTLQACHLCHSVWSPCCCGQG